MPRSRPRERSMMPVSPRFHRGGRPAPSLAVATAIMAAGLLLSACGRATTAERLHLAAVERAESALARPVGDPEREAGLVKARGELEEALRRDRRLEGAQTSLAGVLIALGELEPANELLMREGFTPEPGEKAAMERLQAHLAALREDWATLGAMVDGGMIPAADPIVALTAPYPADLTTSGPWCLRDERRGEAAGDATAPPLATPTERHAAWCRGGLSAEGLLEALGGAPATGDWRAVSAHHRLRAAALAELGRWDEAVTELLAARALLGSALAGRRAAPGGGPWPLQTALDLETVAALAWAGRVSEAKKLVAEVLAAGSNPRAEQLRALLEQAPGP